MLTNPKQVGPDRMKLLRENYMTLKDQMTSLVDQKNEKGFVEDDEFEGFNNGLTTDAQIGKKQTGLTKTLTNMIKIRHLHSQGVIDLY